MALLWREIGLKNCIRRHPPSQMHSLPADADQNETEGKKFERMLARDGVKVKQDRKLLRKPDRVGPSGAKATVHFERS
jgi:hypothetical protein